MRQRGYSHPQLSSGCACRDKRWSGLIPSNKIESYHLLSSVAFASAQWQCPHLKGAHAATTFHCGSRTLGREIKYSCIRQAVCLHFWKGLCEVGAWRAQDQVCKGEEPSPPYKPTHTWTGALAGDTVWKHRLGHEGECSHKQETQENLLQKQNLWESPPLSSRSPKPTNTYFTTPLLPCRSWGLKTARKVPAGPILIHAQEVQKYQRYCFVFIYFTYDVCIPSCYAWEHTFCPPLIHPHSSSYSPLSY